MSNPQRRRYGLIGAGMMGREHIRSLAFVEGAELIGVAEPDAGSLTRLDRSLEITGFAPKCFADWRDMIERTELDAVIIATPNYLHYEALDELMDTDVAILVEKPMCTTLAHAQDIADRARKRSALFQVGLEYRFMPPVADFLAKMHAGNVGRPHMLMIREHRFPFLKKVGDWNRFNDNTGGTLVEKCCHFFDLMRFALQDEPVRVMASGGHDVNHLDERYEGRVPDIIDNAFVLVDFAGGARACLDLCMFAEGAKQQEDISVIGDIAKLEVQIPSGIVTQSPRDRSDPKISQIAVDDAIIKAGSHHGATVYHLRDFHRALVDDSAASISAEDGLKSVQMGLAAQESIKTGQTVDL